MSAKKHVHGKPPSKSLSHRVVRNVRSPGNFDQILHHRVAPADGSARSLPSRRVCTHSRGDARCTSTRASGKNPALQVGTKYSRLVRKDRHDRYMHDSNPPVLHAGFSLAPARLLQRLLRAAATAMHVIRQVYQSPGRRIMKTKKNHQANTNATSSQLHQSSLSFARPWTCTKSSFVKNPGLWK